MAKTWLPIWLPKHLGIVLLVSKNWGSLWWVSLSWLVGFLHWGPSKWFWGTELGIAIRQLCNRCDVIITWPGCLLAAFEDFFFFGFYLDPKTI